MIFVYCDNFSPDIVNVANLATSEPYFHDISCVSNFSGVSQQDCLGHSSYHGLNKTNSATLVNERYKGKFVSSNVVNLSRCNLTRNEVSLPSKGLKFVPTPRVLIKPLSKKNWKSMVGNLDLCGIFVMMRGSLVIILLRKNLNLILKERMQPLNYI